MTDVRVIHFLNQFFAGSGGEDAAGHPVESRRGCVGPGVRLEHELGHEGRFASTLVGGDNFMTEQPAKARDALQHFLLETRPDVVVAGPAFASGRYGLSCALVCEVAGQLNIPAVTAMHPENPGVVGGLAAGVLILPTGSSLTEMNQVLEQLARFALRLARGDALGPAVAEGYLSRGDRRSGFREAPGHQRAVSMLISKLRDSPFTTELARRREPTFSAAKPISDVRRAKVAVISTAGIVPHGNPDRMPPTRSTRYFVYPLSLDRPLLPDEWESIHAGFNTATLNRDPNYGLPWDCLCELQREGRVADLHPAFFSLTGVLTQEPEAKAIAAAITDELNREGVHAAILVAT
jgi:glycine reductase